MSNDFPQIHSLYGRAFGVTPNGYPTGQYGWKDRVTATTSATTATALASYGINTVNIASSANSASFTLSAPETGVPVTLTCISGSSGIATITVGSSVYIITGPISVGPSTAGGASQVTTASTAYTTIKMWQAGQTVELVGISTSLYMVKQLSGFSTSTGGGARLS